MSPGTVEFSVSLLVLENDNTRLHRSVHRNRILYYVEFYSFVSDYMAFTVLFHILTEVSSELLASHVVSLEQRTYGVHVVKSLCVGSIRVAHLGADVAIC